ncbi:MAG: SRPBCC family protein [Janthinobacterium lividum]
MDVRPLTASLDIAAAPHAVWALVADVRRTGEWSPECVRVVPVGVPRRGSFLLGINRRAKVRWATLSRVHVYEPEHEIGWTVLTNRASWSYRLEARGQGTRLTESRRTPRGEGLFAVWFTKRLLGGQDQHDDELEAGMRAGLQHIKQLVEAAT